MTGNVVFLGFSTNPHSGLSPAAAVIAIAGFMAGALAGGRAAHSLAAARPGRWLATAVAAEALILGLAAALTGAGVPHRRLGSVAAMLAGAAAGAGLLQWSPVAVISIAAALAAVVAGAFCTTIRATRPPGGQPARR
jgi:uncharacterized membrane protein YoaK (UPF0700 family)